MAPTDRSVILSGPFRARPALTLTNVADRNKWDDEHREAVAADFIVSWNDPDEESDGLRALVVTAAAPFPTPGVVVYLAKQLHDSETIEVRAIAHHLL